MADHTEVPPQGFPLHINQDGSGFPKEARPDDGVNLTTLTKVQLMEKLAIAEREKQEWYDRAVGAQGRERQAQLTIRHLKEKVEQAQAVNTRQFHDVLELRTQSVRANEVRDQARLDLNDTRRQLNDLAVELRQVGDVLVKEVGYTPDTLEREGVVACVRRLATTETALNEDSIVRNLRLGDYLEEKEVAEFGLRQVLFRHLEDHKNWSATVRVTGTLVPTLAYACADGWVRVAPGHYNELTSALKAAVEVSGGAAATSLAEDHGERYARLEQYLQENWPLWKHNEAVEDAIDILELVRTSMPAMLKVVWHQGVVPAMRTLARAGYDMSGLLGAEAQQQQNQDDNQNQDEPTE